MHPAHGYAAHSSSTPLVPHTFSRRDLHPNDLRITASNIKYRFVIDMSSLQQQPA